MKNFWLKRHKERIEAEKPKKSKLSKQEVIKILIDIFKQKQPTKGKANWPIKRDIKTLP